MNMSKEILIKKICLEGSCKVKAYISISGSEEIIVTEYSSNVADYISIARADAVVTGLLVFAIHHRLDIKSEVPLSETFYYKLTHHFLPGICCGDLYMPRITAEVLPDEVFSADAKIVATGISCGVDSLYSVMEHTHDVSNEMKLTHLVFLNAGAHHFGTREQGDALYEGRKERARSFSETNGLPLVEISTNFPEIVDKYGRYDHLCNHTYMMLLCILPIQHGVKKYYYSAGYPYSDFSCRPKGQFLPPAAHYDLFILWLASNKNIEFYSTGGSLTRFDKVKSLKGYKPGEDYLNVCVTSVDNCGECFKCKRTLLELDAAGSLDNYGKVFDVDAYKAVRRARILEGYRGAVKGDDLLLEMMPFFKAEISPSARLAQRVRVFIGKVCAIRHKLYGRKR